MTGESLPLPRAAGDQALAGGGVAARRLVILAERVGAATTTGRIAGYIQEDIVLLEGRLDSLVTILSLAQNTMQLIHSNFAAAVGVNTAILAGAASGALAPVASAALLGRRSTQQG